MQILCHFSSRFFTNSAAKVRKISHMCKFFGKKRRKNERGLAYINYFYYLCTRFRVIKFIHIYEVVQ
jgi:hypothetical protein